MLTESKFILRRTPFVERKRPTSGDAADIEAAQNLARQRTYERILEFDGRLDCPAVAYTRGSRSLSNPRQSISGGRNSMGASIPESYAVSSHAAEVVLSFLAPASNDRLSAHGLLLHRWMKM